MSRDATELDRWLEVATRGLSVPSRARVEREIREHFRDALGAGLEPSAALEDLGSPVAAGRAFRRAHLTSFQEALVRDYRGRPPAWRRAIYVSLCALAIGIAVWGTKTTAQQVVGAVVVGVMLAALAGAVVFVERFYRQGRERLAILLGASCDFTLYVGLIVGSHLMLGNLGTARAALFGAIFVVLLALYLPLVRKLGSDREPSAR
jgi:hypothetical protein